MKVKISEETVLIKLPPALLISFLASHLALVVVGKLFNKALEVGWHEDRIKALIDFISKAPNGEGKQNALIQSRAIHEPYFIKPKQPR
jgi:hypothetical protein